MKFSDMSLNEKTLAALDSLNFFEPTEVQIKTIPLLLSGDELIVRSQTGTGKTAAFGIAIIEQIIADKNKKGLILAPTRELAIQITKDLRAISTNHYLRIYAIYGGDDIGRQFRVLKNGYDIIVATPGRLLDHVQRKTIDLPKFNLVVLDEADRMLDMGFREDISNILSRVSSHRQMMLFSATISHEIQDIAEEYMQSPTLIEVGDAERKNSIEQNMIRLTRREKFDKLKEIIHSEPDSRIIVFVATQRVAEYIGGKLMDQKIKCNYLHGGMRQAKRERIMRDFSEGRFRILVATDVAARGLHIEDVAHIINYDEARDKETHLHRIGRTGRMGKTGKATTFVETDQVQRQPFKRHVRRYDPRGGRSQHRGIHTRTRY